MPTLDKIWANDEAVIVFENGYANYGWSDYRNNHLGPEMKEMTNVKYDSSDIKAHVSGKMAYATFKYTISGDSNGKHFEVVHPLHITADNLTRKSPARMKPWSSFRHLVI